jgi:hypothetical protein
LCIKGKRLTRRIKWRWDDDTENDLGAIWCEVVKWSESAQDRV